mmetsp:Transcript_10643/g.10723  ORF Transcript_10643/g.10723 Transcript_10643/m.10723 type:complete len:107 (-) Transcript_10643:1803-2123(-)
MIEGNEHTWISFMEHPVAEVAIPEIPQGVEMETEVIRMLKKLIILKILRPDRFMKQAKEFIGKILGEEVMNPGELDLARIVEKESNCKSPLLLVSAPGYDASYKVD